MLGAFIGDIAGSFREFSRNKYPELGLLPSREDVYKHTTSGKTGYGITDDSILTLATMKALMEIDAFPDYSSTATFAAAYKRFGLANRDPIGGYGEGFSKWMRNGSKAYNSCGNGSAMRVSPVGYWSMNPDEVLETAFASAVCTHSHPEGIKGAQATALAIYLARHKDLMGFTSFSDINDHLHVKLIGYDAVEQFDHFDAICPDTMRLATHILLSTNNFHDAVFKAVITPRADSDTLGAIVGSIAEPLYGIPDDIADYAKSFIPAPHMDLIKQFDEHCVNR